jgi:hypothetical protein
MYETKTFDSNVNIPQPRARSHRDQMTIGMNSMKEIDISIRKVLSVVGVPLGH